MNLYDVYMSPRERANRQNAVPAGISAIPAMERAAAGIPEPQTPPEKPVKDPLEGRSLAMVYAPRQSFSGIYDPETALSRGTLFEALDKPILTAGGNK